MKSTTNGVAGLALGWGLAVLIAAGFAFAGCGIGGGGGGSDGSDGADGDPGPAGPPGPVGPPAPLPGADEVGAYDPLPGVVVVIQSVTGGTGLGGNFRAGDVPTVLFTAKQTDGTDLDVPEMDSGSIYLSGPSFNYQRVIPSQSNLRAASVAVGGGVWSYTFPTPIPAVFAAPYNDSPSFGTEAGELSGQALLDGTYTVGMQLYKTYTVENEQKRDAGVAVFDVLYGSATSIEHREVVTNANCNSCHTELRIHGGGRKDVRLCVLCHTSGAEDKNVASAAGGTPGLTIDFRVMIHKIHNGAHLPSVLGVGVNADGSKNYGVTPKPYEIVGYQNSVIDFSEVGFPVMPSAYVAYLFDQAGTTYTGTGGNGPMPRDLGYGVLAPPQKLQEDKIRTGVVACGKCHDGAANGDLYYLQPTRKACGSCHDDIDFSKPYTSNGSTMPAQTHDGACVICHSPTGGSLPIKDSHVHPYSNPAVNPGVNLVVTAVGGGTGIGANHQPGDPISTTFTLKDDAGTDLQIQKLTRMQVIVSGPSSNPQVLGPNVNLFDFGFRKSSPFTGAGTVTGLNVGVGAIDQVLAVVFTATNTFDVIGSVSGTILTGQFVPAGGNLAVTAAGVSFTVNDTGTDFAAGDRFYLEVVPLAASYTKNAPIDVSFERVGMATGGADLLAVSNLPLYWGRQTVWERTALVGAAAPIAESVASLQRFVVADASLLVGNLVVGDRVVLDAGTATEEYLQVGRIQTTDDANGADLGTSDRIWFTTAIRFAHLPGATVQEATLSGRREGLTYAVTNPALGQITLVAGQFTVGNPVVMSYRTDLRFGRRRAPGDALQSVFPEAAADSEEIEASWGDWKGLPFVDGTYQVGFWVNRDFSVSGNVPSTPNGEATTYRMISPPATRSFLFGTASSIVLRTVIADGAACNACHGDLQFHGFGRRGLATCLNCHAGSGLEDGPKYSFNSWYTGPTPGTGMEFRQLLHKIHMGKELDKAATYTAVGVFLGIPYNARYGEVGFPAMPDGVKQCEKCHGAGNPSWEAPAPRSHPDAPVPVRTWRSACSSCHDSDAAKAHIDTSTSGGVETCATCHGANEIRDVVKVHFPR